MEEAGCEMELGRRGKNKKKRSKNDALQEGKGEEVEVSWSSGVRIGVGV